jgi:hypothetical protein
MYKNVTFDTKVTIFLGQFEIPPITPSINCYVEYLFKDIEIFRRDIISMLRYYSRVHIFGIQTLSQFDAVYAILNPKLIRDSLLQIKYIDADYSTKPITFTYDGKILVPVA